MTQDNRAAFEKWAKKGSYIVDGKPNQIAMWAWQASEQRILDMLGSDEMVEVVAAEIMGLDTNAESILTAIITRIKGE